MKSDATKIEELINIRKQLNQLGFLVIPDNNTLLQKHSNAYLTENITSTFTLKIPSEQTKAIITLSNIRQSGIVLEA